ncbi:MAG: LacI family DNA-binding transcriptional regulator, partial [Verrucomicrobiae bacterium]|nr:LacI family DNA-binding transcriptional regulator [Verrucomicrobiae bacterium]
MSHRPVTIKEVAARAGVSIMTVSKVMNDAPDISAGTKEKIRGLAREMGYRTNPIARGLRLKSTRTVGVLVPLLDEEHISEVVAAIESQLQG